MQEILFRGKRVDNGEWVEGVPVPIIINSYPTNRIELVRSHSYDELDNFNLLSDDEEIIPTTLGQYTGFQDKNGAKIFEGDIIRGTGSKAKEENFAISWSDATCGFVAGIGMSVKPNLNQATVSNYEIVGNVYDNPGLLVKEGE